MPHDEVIGIVDDDEGARESLQALLETAGYKVLTFASAAKYLAEGETAGAGCLIVDLKMPQIDGLRFHQILVDSGIKTPVVFVTAFGDVPSAVQAMKNGAIDFMEKPYDDKVMVETVQYALRQAAVPPPEVEEPFPDLSPREQQVLRNLLGGLSNKEIARVLGISPRTVEIHRSNLMRRTGTRTLAHLLQLAMSAGLKFMPRQGAPLGDDT